VIVPVTVRSRPPLPTVELEILVRVETDTDLIDYPTGLAWSLELWEVVSRAEPIADAEAWAIGKAASRGNIRA